MRRSDIDLITALAEGRLEDETKARALIDRSPRLRELYESQKRVIDTLTELPPATLTQTERAALHRDLWSELSTGVRSATTPARSGLRWGYAAAALLVVVGAASVIGQLDRPEMLAGVADEERASTDDGAQESGGTAVPLGATPSTIATAEEDLGADFDTFAAYAAEARKGTLAYQQAPQAPSSESGTALEQCVEEAGLEDSTVLGVMKEEAHRYGVAAIGETTGPDSVIVFVDLETCSIAHRDG